MARETEKRAASVEAALEAALEELGITEQEGVVEVVQEPKSGFLGVGGQEAVVRVRRRSEELPPDGLPDDLPDDLEEQADIAADFVEELLARMDIDAVAEPNARGDHMYVDIVDGPEDDMALLIGRHGQTLDAIQDLMRMAVGRRLDERIRVIVDVEDYRKRREAKLEERARELAQRVARGGTEEELEPMNAYERKLVHDAVAEVAGVESASHGEDPNRYVVIRKH
jgi:spoIIIJ-associated protein